ncbi:head-tail connector protein [Paraferrimonas haliotis]|nr:head-tail connector protein [Paraferrimonas haliotis]
MQKLMINLETVKKQVHIEDDDTEHDVLLGVYISAAKKHVADYLNRTVYWPEDIKPEESLRPEHWMDANEPCELAGLLVIAHWFANRESVVVGTITSEVPQGFKALLNPYRIINV